MLLTPSAVLDAPTIYEHQNTARQGEPMARTFNSSIAPRSVPMEIDLNEFMLDTDLDLFSRQFDLGQQY